MSYTEAEITRSGEAFALGIIGAMNGLAIIAEHVDLDALRQDTLDLLAQDDLTDAHQAIANGMLKVYNTVEALIEALNETAGLEA